jgi:hypothetical protein
MTSGHSEASSNNNNSKIADTTSVCPKSVALYRSLNEFFDRWERGIGVVQRMSDSEDSKSTSDSEDSTVCASCRDLDLRLIDLDSSS